MGLDITIYSTKTCPYCRMAKEFLNSKNIKYKDIDVGSDREGAKEMVKKSGQMGVPVLDINGKIIVGFDKEAIEQALSQ
ncbi:MAG: NrdH-redoxin [Candidatus Altiarchaeales archaeon]|nr:NrdH-redoxin [Candidatus Altiarchaeales archaeon]